MRRRVLYLLVLLGNSWACFRVLKEHGYEGASLADLTRAMGINRPSMYAAFGNKEALFRKALDRYVDQGDCWVREALPKSVA